jgi:NADH-quinone oxidoreductase subunit I
MPILRGLQITLANFCDAVPAPGLDRLVPEQKRPVSSRYRGIHILTEREDGTPKCVACYMCATVCPAECIYIESGERPEKMIEKYPTRFEIDLLRCVYCGFCVDACPEEAIIMSRENDLVGTTRAELIIDRDRLMARGKLVEHGPGYRPDEHDVRRPVRIAALERLKSEHGIVPGMPAPKTPAAETELGAAILGMRSDGAPRTLFAAIFVGLMPFLMGAAAFYFTSGVVVSCEPSGPNERRAPRAAGSRADRHTAAPAPHGRRRRIRRTTGLRRGRRAVHGALPLLLTRRPVDSRSRPTGRARTWPARSRGWTPTRRVPSLWACRSEARSAGCRSSSTSRGLLHRSWAPRTSAATSRA